MRENHTKEYYHGVIHKERGVERSSARARVCVERESCLYVCGERDSEGVWVVCVFVEKEREREREELWRWIGKMRVCVKHKGRKGEFIHRVG